MNELRHSKTKGKKARKQKIVDKAFDDFMEELVIHCYIAGGLIKKEEFRNKTLEEVFKHLWPNGIRIGFLNQRIKPDYRRSRFSSSMYRPSDYYEEGAFDETDEDYDPGLQ